MQDSLRDEAVHAAYQLHQAGYNLYATKATYDFLQACHVPCHLLNYPNQPGACVFRGWLFVPRADVDRATHPLYLKRPTKTDKHPNVLDYLRGGKIDLVINLPTPESKQVRIRILTD